MRAKENTVWKTDNYKMFKHLEGNRSIKDRRVKAVLKSIDAVGYVCSPIIVNENNEVIDGQARLTALELLGLPVDYIVVKGIGLEECRAMNLQQSNWTLDDYIDSYAETGRNGYNYLRALLKEYKARIGVRTILFTACDRIGSSIGHGAVEELIKTGNFEMTDAQYDAARATCTYLSRYSDMLRDNAGRKDCIYHALRYAYQQEDVNGEDLYSKMYANRGEIVPVTNVEQAIAMIESIYNYRTRAHSRVYLVDRYKKMIADTRFVGRAYAEGKKR